MPDIATNYTASMIINSYYDMRSHNFRLKGRTQTENVVYSNTVGNALSL